ncbi:MAG: 4Fe-4S binding protein [Planctomycetaceae bacterium]|nr:4Fe-4S binding protein [Planctomycetaceae bacterium]
MFRLNWFLPFLRKAKKGATVELPGLVERAARRVLPTSWFADRITGKPGLIRRGLKKLGDSWLSSPWRRVMQGVCFVGFLTLFCYVCWPYTARPAGVWPGWVPIEIDASNSLTTVALETPLARPLADGRLLYAVDPSAAAIAGKPPAVTFRVTQGGDQRLLLTPAETLSPERIEELSLSVSPWTLYEQPPGAWPAHYADELARKERVAAELFLIIDPLVSLSTALAARSWVWSLTAAVAILAVCVIVPRGFCGYLCPLGTLIDLFDWSIGRRVTRFRVADDGWWVHLKYYVLLATLIAGLGGVLISGYVAAIPVITRGMLFLLGPLQTGLQRGQHLIPPWNAGHVVSLALFFAVLGLGLLKPRFWCKYVCPSGAVFSLGNLFRLSERKVESSCIHCNKCVEICPFDAIKPDFTTRTSDCTLCQTCGGVCPVHAIKFVDRFDFVDLKLLNDPPTHETPLGRRGFLATGVGLLAGSAGGVAAATGIALSSPDLNDPTTPRPVRPPGSVSEREFWQLCIRCGECFKACPNDVLQPLGFAQGLAGLWTPQVVADWAGCESSCNACTQVCPTGAIRALTLDEKRHFRMGLAVVNKQTCLPIAGREACQLCVDECVAAGYHAIEFVQVRTEVDKAGNPIEGTGFLAPVVLAEKCVGCGLCQTRCYGINVIEKQLLPTSAIIIEAGAGKEDR